MDNLQISTMLQNISRSTIGSQEFKSYSGLEFRRRLLENLKLDLNAEKSIISLKGEFKLTKTDNLFSEVYLFRDIRLEKEVKNYIEQDVIIEQWMKNQVKWDPKMGYLLPIDFKNILEKCHEIPEQPHFKTPFLIGEFRNQNVTNAFLNYENSFAF